MGHRDIASKYPKGLMTFEVTFQLRCKEVSVGGVGLCLARIVPLLGGNGG